MSDISDTADVNQPASISADPNAAVPATPTEPPAEPVPEPMTITSDEPATPTATDDLIVPPQEEIKPPESPKTDMPLKEEKPKKQMRPSVMITSLLIMLITLPLAVIAVKNTLNLFGYACSSEDYACRHENKPPAPAPKPPVDKGEKDNPPPAPVPPVDKGEKDNTPATSSKYDVKKGQPPGTYAVYKNGASSGEIVGYRYIQAPGVFEGAIQRATGTYNPYGNNVQPVSQQDIELLKTQYGLSGDNLKRAADAIANGETWAPPGTGCNDTPASEDPNNPAYCHGWHWTTCTNKGTGVNGIGCDVPKDDKPKTKDEPPGNPPPQCVNIVAYRNGNALSADELKALKAGDTVTLAYAPGGTATKVRFRVKAGDTMGDWNETTTKNSNSQFVWDYTLTDATSFNIEAQWFDGSAWH